MTCHMFLERNFKDKVSRNKVKNKAFKDVRIELIDYKKDWVKKVSLKGYI